MRYYFDRVLGISRVEDVSLIIPILSISTLDKEPGIV